MLFELTGLQPESVTIALRSRQVAVLEPGAATCPVNVPPAYGMRALAAVCAVFAAVWATAAAFCAVFAAVWATAAAFRAV